MPRREEMLCWTKSILIPNEVRLSRKPPIARPGSRRDPEFSRVNCWAIWKRAQDLRLLAIFVALGSAIERARRYAETNPSALDAAGVVRGGPGPNPPSYSERSSASSY